MTEAIVKNANFEVNAQRPFIGDGSFRDSAGTVAEVGTTYVWNEANLLVPMGVDYGRGMVINGDSSLRHEEWIKLDTAVVEVKLPELRLVDWFTSNGFVEVLPNAIGTPTLSYENVSDMRDAEVSMDGISITENDTVNFGIRYMPTPVIYKDFTIDMRRLAASRRTGEPLDVRQARYATRKVKEKIEDLFLSANFKAGEGTLYGLTTFPYRMTGGTSEGVWTGSSKTGEDIFADVQAMIAQMVAKNIVGPFTLFIPQAYEAVLSKDYRANDSRTIRDRLLEIGGLVEIVTIPRLAANNVILVQKSMDTGVAVQGIPTTLIQGEKAKGWLKEMRVQEMTLPRFYADHNDAAGIVHWVITG